MNLNLTDNLRQLAKVLLWVLNFVAWWLGIIAVLWPRIRPHYDFLPNSLPLGAFMLALCINIALGFAVHGLYSKS